MARQFTEDDALVLGIQLATPLDQECSICKEPFGDSCIAPSRLPSCGHIFGRSCILEWFTEQRVTGEQPHCPLCRTLHLPTQETNADVCFDVMEENLNKIYATLLRTIADMQRILPLLRSGIADRAAIEPASSPENPVNEDASSQPTLDSSENPIDLITKGDGTREDPNILH